MEHIELNPEIKEILTTYLVPENFIQLIEEDQNVKMQAVADHYKNQLQEYKQEIEQENNNKELSEGDFMQKLNDQRIVKK